jgi:hypothetical protein
MRILISDQNFGDAAKPAVVEKTEVLAIEWAEQAVQVKAIGPSTEFVDKGSATAYRLVEPAEPPWLFTSGAAFSPLCRLRAGQLSAGRGIQPCGFCARRRGYDRAPGVREI